MASWDKRADNQLRRLPDELVRGQVRAVAAGSAYWRARFAAIGRTPASISGAAALESVPAVGERDVSPAGDPAAMAALVLHGGERQFALHSSGPQLRRAIRLRATAKPAYRRIVDSETKPTSYAAVWRRRPSVSIKRPDDAANARSGSDASAGQQKSSVICAIPRNARPESCESCASAGPPRKSG